ncbi:MAG: hypothetical protein U0984_09555 [Prosthecobacter sp.]|nr:hypothetical protein [Prosthecobacter sp.]
MNPSPHPWNETQIADAAVSLAGTFPKLSETLLRVLVHTAATEVHPHHGVDALVEGAVRMAGHLKNTFRELADGVD